MITIDTDFVNFNRTEWKQKTKQTQQIILYATHFNKRHGLRVHFVTRLWPWILINKSDN